MHNLMVGTLMIILCLLVAGCFDSISPEDKKIIADKNVENVALAKEIKDLTDRIKSGDTDVNVKEVMTALEKAKDKLTENKEVISTIAAKEGVSTSELVFFSLGNMALTLFGLRGLPSKGPFSFIRRLMGGSNRTE